MMVSMATAVLPVWRSPMISSRWPRPIGTSASMALRPVCIGSCTLLRFTMPGALISILRVCFASMGPRPSMGLPRASTTRPSSASPTGTSAIWPVRLTVSPSRMSSACAHDGDADVVLLEVQHQAADAALELDQLAGGDAGEAVDAGDAVGLREHGAGLGDVDLLAVVLDLLADDAADLVGADVHVRSSPELRVASASGAAQVLELRPERSRRRPGCPPGRPRRPGGPGRRRVSTMTWAFCALGELLGDALRLVGRERDRARDLGADPAEARVGELAEVVRRSPAR